jgi:hypothetical protein
MKIDDWLAAAVADAERRGLPELKPLLETLARSTAALRDEDRTARSAADAEPRTEAGDEPKQAAEDRSL